VPVFSTDGLKHYFYSLTAHLGYWEPIEGSKKTIWVVLSTFVNGWVMMFQRKRKLIEVERQVI